MTWDREITEQLAACRPKSNDRNTPEMDSLRESIASDTKLAAHAQRLESFDRTVQASLHSQKVPQGLKAQLLETVRKQSVNGISPQEQIQNVEHSPIVATVSKNSSVPTKSLTRRKWLSATLAIAATVLIAAGVSYFQMPEEPWTAAQLEQEAATWMAQLPSANWQTKGKPILPQGIRVPAKRWCSINLQGSSNLKVTAFDLTPPNASELGLPECQLFVTKQTVTGLPPVPPATASFTQGRLIAAWKSNDQVCVLVLRGNNEAELRAFYREWFAGNVMSA